VRFNANRELREAHLRVSQTLGDLLNWCTRGAAFVLVFDICREGVLFLLHELENGLDRRISLAPWEVVHADVRGDGMEVTASLAILQVNVRNVRVILLDERDRVVACGGEVADIQVYADV
jgi:hypothetical protein